MPAAVTPTGVRDGHPVALAGLCAARGPSVLAYCRHIAGDDGADTAAAEAFAAFRVGVVATPDLTELNPEALLINATRRAAASRAPRAPIGVCAVVPLLLAARADKTISAPDLEVLEQHLAGCWACRAPVARFDAAERAYRDPPSPLMDPGVIAAIIAAMAAAVPARDDERAAAAPDGDPPLPPAAQTAPVVQTMPGAAVAATTAGGGADRPTTEFRIPGVLEPDRAAHSDAAPAPARPARRAGIVPSLLGSLRLRQGREPAPAARVAEPEPADEPVLETVEKTPARRRARSAAGGARIPRAVRPPAAATAATSAPVGVLAGSATGSRGGGRTRGRGKLPLPVVLPLAVVLIAVLVALFVSGVFGGDDPASSSRIAVPSDVPAQSTPADVVVVPGAREASPDEVELAKARDRARARARRRREAAAPNQAAATTPPRATSPANGASPPPAPAPAAQPPPPPPPPATANRDDGSRKVDAGSGATGAEQIPPAEDTSTVPDLAPAPEPATAP